MPKRECLAGAEFEVALESESHCFVGKFDEHDTSPRAVLAVSSEKLNGPDQNKDVDTAVQKGFFKRGSREFVRSIYEAGFGQRGALKTLGAFFHFFVGS